MLWPAPTPTTPTTPTTPSHAYLHTYTRNPNDSSPLSSLSPSPTSASALSRAGLAPSPNTLPGWRVDVMPGGRKYPEYKERKQKEKSKDAHPPVVYTSRKKEEKATSKSANDTEGRERNKLFIPSPKLADATLTTFSSHNGPNSHRIADTDTDVDPLNLFSPPPADTRALSMRDGDREPLFSPPPSPRHEPYQEQHPERTRKPGVGVARRVVRTEEEARSRSRKRRRQVMKYVLVPPAPHWVKRARLDWEARNERAGESRGRRWDSAHRSGSRRTYGYRSELSSSRSRSRSTVDPRRRAPAPMKTKTKIMTQRKTETGEGQVHASLGDALNNSWAHNEAMGTIPVGRAAGEGAEKGKRKHEVQEDEKERLAKRPKKGKVAVRQETEVREGAKRKARALRRPDNDMLVAPAVPPQSCGAWCEEGTEDGVGGVIRLHFDVTVAEADHAACAALLNTGIPGFNVEPAGVETSASLAEDVRGGLRPTCLVWPPRLEEGEYDVSAGESVYGSNELPHRPQRIEGRTKRAKLPPRSATTVGPHQEPERYMESISVAHEIQYGEQPPHTKPKSKVKGQSHTLPAQTSSQLFPAVNSPPSGDSPSEPHPNSTSWDPDVQETEVVVDAPMTLSAKAMGKQKMPDEDARRMASPEQLNAWVHNSGSRERHHGRFDESPVGEMTPFYGFDQSPPRINRSGLQISPEGLHYYPTAPTISDSIPTSFMHPLELQRVPSLVLMPDEPYGDGTVDPSMLMSGLMVPDVVEPSDREPETEDPYELEDEEGSYENENEEEEEVARMASPSSSSPSSSSSEPSSPSPVGLRASRRAPVQRRMPDDMVPTDGLDFDFDDSSSSSSFVYMDRSPKPSPKPASKPKPIKSKPATAKRVKATIDDTVIPALHNPDPFYRYIGPPWPPGDPDAFCHQCRRKSKRLSMRFEDCQHIYCVGCIMTKYEPRTVRFEAMSPSTNCCKCNDSCSCDNCCSRRGEAYQFSRHRSEADPREPHAPRTVTRPQHNPYQFLNDIVVEPTTYHAILYDFNGAPIARTFFGADGDTNVVVTQLRRRRREFIGDLHESWRSLGPNPTVYVDPPLPGELKPNGKKRLYIGDQSVLSLHVRARARAPSPPPVPLVAIPAEDLVTGVPAAPADPVATPAPVPDLEANLLNLDSLDAGAPVPATPQTPAPADMEVDFDLPSPFASPLTSIDSDTASGDEADRVVEKGDDKGSAVNLPMPAVAVEMAGGEDLTVNLPTPAVDSKRAADEDPTVSSVMAALNDYASSAAESEDEEPRIPSEAAGEAQAQLAVLADV